MDARDIPSDIVEEIFCTLDVKDVISASQTCMAWYEVTTTRESLWRRLCSKYGVQRSPTRSSAETTESKIRRLMQKAVFAAKKSKVKRYWLSKNFNSFIYEDYERFKFDETNVPFICEMTCNDWGDILDNQLSMKL